MTRANINFISQNTGETPKTLFVYHNGDQYPQGIRDIYNVLDFIESEMTIEDFKKWIKDNYDGEQIEEIDQPKIYYTDGFITDYSYIFDTMSDNIYVYCWSNKVFDGNKDEFIKWIKEQK